MFRFKEVYVGFYFQPNAPENSLTAFDSTLKYKMHMPSSGRETLLIAVELQLATMNFIYITNALQTK